LFPFNTYYLVRYRRCSEDRKFEQHLVFGGFISDIEGGLLMIAFGNYTTCIIIIKSLIYLFASFSSRKQLKLNFGMFEFESTFCCNHSIILNPMLGVSGTGPMVHILVSCDKSQLMFNAVSALMKI